MKQENKNNIKYYYYFNSYWKAKLCER